jgi:putative transposase
VTYANEAKRDLLGVPQELLDAHGAVSEPVVRAMVEGALRVSGADIAVAVTGIAGPDGGTPEKPVGTVWLAWAAKGRETLSVKQIHPRNRKDFKLAVSQAALDGMRRMVNVVHASDVQQERAGSGSPIFRPFDPATQTHDTARRRLPHWTKEGVTYYVTFRLADSIPEESMQRWIRQKNEWLATKGIKTPEFGPVSLESLPLEQRKEYRKLFGESFQAKLDEGHGSCLLAKPENAKIVAQAMEHFDGERYLLGDYVVMPNHVHVLLVPLEGVSLTDILRSWKTFTAREINEREGRSGGLWQRESFDHIVRSREQLERIRGYIAENPAGLREGKFLLRRREWK